MKTLYIYYFKKKVRKFEMSHVTPGKVLSIHEYRIGTLHEVPLQKHRQGPFDERSLLCSSCSSTDFYSGTYKIHRPNGGRSAAVELEE